MSQDISKGLPDLNDPVSGQFWRAASEQRLELPHCSECQQSVWYPTAPTPCCNSKLEWREHSSKAKLITWTEVQLPINPHFKPPYIVALVEPAGTSRVRLLTRIIDTPAQDLVCDMDLNLDFKTLETLSGERFIAPVYKVVN